MAAYIPKEKLSKKAKKDMYNKQRNTWSVSPVTRVVSNKKQYTRKKKFPDYDYDYDY